MRLFCKFSKKFLSLFYCRNNLENIQNDVRMQTETYNTILGKSEEKLRRETSFVRRNYSFYWIATILYIVASLGSAFTIFMHINLRAGETFYPTVAIIIASFITLVIAGCQYMIEPLVDDFQARAHIKGGSDGALMFLKGLAALVGIVGGVWLSINGASKAVDVVRKDTTLENVVLISEDSIARYWDAQIAQVNASIGKQEGTTYRRKITAQANENLSSLFNTVNKLQEKKAAELADAKAKNDAALLEYKEETKVNAAGAKGFMGFLELLILITAVMRGLFNDGLKKEAKKIGVQAGQPF